MLTLTVILSLATAFCPDLSATQLAVVLGVCLLAALFPSIFLAAIFVLLIAFFLNSR